MADEHNIDVAISMLAQEVEELLPSNRNTAGQGQGGSVDWFLLRAKSLGLSSLKRMRQLNLHRDPAAAERYHRKAEKYHVRQEVADGD